MNCYLGSVQVRWARSMRVQYKSDWQHFFDTLNGYVEKEEATTKFNRTF